MPAGELFRIYFQGDLGEVTSSFMTDVKVTLQNPTNVLPFDNVYKTTSTEWTSWYNDMLTKAENFDRFELENITEWWKKKAGKRYEKMVAENKVRTELEVWNQSTMDKIDIIR